MNHLLLICAQRTFLSVIGAGILTAAPPQKAPLEKPVAPAAAVVDPNVGSLKAMQLSIEKQKAAVRLQIGEGGAAAAFFTTPWISPPLIVATPASPDCDPMAESDIALLVKDAALAQDLNPGLIRAVIRQESASFACAISAKGAVGLMQLMPDTAQQFAADPYDAKQNVQAGSKYLKQLLTRYKGDTRLALAAYNAGPDRVDATGSVPAIPETAAYVEAILHELQPDPAAVSTGPKPE